MVLVDSTLSAPHEPEVHDESVQTPAPVQEEKVQAEVRTEQPAPDVQQPQPEPKNNGIRGLGVPEGRKIVIGGHYKHFKGGDYVVLNVAKDHETCREQAVYMQIYGKPVIWVRPLDMFLEDVDDHGNVKPRFALVQD